jgi:guanosine-3',5'-bis(diphosphate) 3'-pyrophosphohydrolase
MNDRHEEPHRRYAAALMYALEKHACQRRRDGTPYVVHPIRVAESLRTIGGIDDHDVVLAGLLHDLIEDTDCEHDDLQQRFGSRVARIVSELSGDMRLPKVERRREVIERIRCASPEAKVVRLADRLDNLTDMAGFSERRRAEYVEQSELTLDACRGANAPLEDALARAIAALRAGQASPPAGKTLT